MRKILRGTLGALCCIGMMKGATVSNGLIYSLTPLFDVRLITAGSGPGGQFACYIAASVDGKIIIGRDNLAKPIVVEDDLPGGQKIVRSKFACYDNGTATTVMFLASDPTHIVGNNPTIVLRYATSDGTGGALLDSNTTFVARDPKANGANVTFKYVQAGSWDFRGQKAYVLAVATPPQVPGFPGAPIPELLLVQATADSSIKDLGFNNAITDKDNYFGNLPTLAVTDGAIYLAGQLTAQPGPTKTAQAVYRIGTDGKPQQVKGYTELYGRGIAALSNGIQTYSVNLDKTNTLLGVDYKFLPDSAPVLGQGFANAEVSIYSGAVIDGVALNGSEVQYPTGPQELYLTLSGSLLKISGSQGRLVKIPSLAPNGNAVQVETISDQVYYVQNENINRTYTIFSPAIQNPTPAGRQGESVAVICQFCFIENKQPSPSVSAGSRVFAITTGSAGNTATFTITIPADMPIGTYQGAADVQGIRLSFSLTVRAAGSPASPKVISAVSSALLGNEKGPLAPRMAVTVQFTGTAGLQAAADPGAISAGNVSMALDDGTQFQMLGNSGTGIATAIVPGSAGLRTRGTLILSVGGLTADPFPVTFAGRFDILYRFVIEGSTAAYMTDDSGKFVGTKISPAKAGSTVTAYGTGCGSGGLDDGQAVPDGGVAIDNSPNIHFSGGQSATVSATLVPGFVGTCAYKFSLQDVQAGTSSFWFGDNSSLGPVYSLAVQ